MLWYKAWLETRLRFLICLIGMTFACVDNVRQMGTGLAASITAANYGFVLHKVSSELAIFWLLAMNLTTMGGLLREKSVGASSFTLALPFSRARLALVRIVLAAIESLAMIVVPWAAVFSTVRIVGTANPLSPALMYLAFLTGGGMVYFAIALLASSLVEGEYIAPLISAGVVFAIASALDREGLRTYNPLNFMSGGNHGDLREGLLTGPIPWDQIAVYGLVSVVLVIASVRALQAREF